MKQAKRRYRPSARMAKRQTRMECNDYDHLLANGHMLANWHGNQAHHDGTEAIQTAHSHSLSTNS